MYVTFSHYSKYLPTTCTIGHRYIYQVQSVTFYSVETVTDPFPQYMDHTLDMEEVHGMEANMDRNPIRSQFQIAAGDGTFQKKHNSLLNNNFE